MNRSMFIFGSFMSALGVYMTHTAYLAGGAFIAGMLVELTLLFFFMRMMYDAGAVGENYRREEVPVGVGISFPSTLVLIFTAYAIMARYDLWGAVFTQDYWAYLFGITAVAMMGFLDDILGSRDNPGLWHNLVPLAHGRLTTGGLKITGGFVVCFLVAFLTSGSWLDCVINTFIMFFLGSLMNWLDLQPGRALKGFVLFLAAIILIALGSVDYILIAPLAGAVFCYLLYDMRARALMGDAGANVLGFSLGFWAVFSLSLSARVAFLLFLAVVQFSTERFAIRVADEERSLFSRINENNR